MKEQFISVCLSTLKIPNINEILPDPRGDVEANPALENVKMSSGDKVAAYPDQDHLAHLISHFAYFIDPNYGGNPILVSTLAPLLLQHVKQHITMHYLQSMRNDVEATMGEDIFDLEEEKPMSIVGQQALAMTSITVAQKGKDLFNGFNQYMQKLQKAAADATKSKQEQDLMKDPSSAVLLKTSQLQNEIEKSRMEHEYKVKFEELAAKVAELQAKSELDNRIEDNKVASAIALKSMDNQAKENLEYIKAGIQLDQASQQANMEQDKLNYQAVQQAEAELRSHGLDLQKQEQQNKFDAQTMQTQLGAQAQQAQQQQSGAMRGQLLQQASQTEQANQQRQHEAKLQQNQQQAQQQNQQADHNNALDLGMLPMLAQQLGATPGMNPKNQVVSNLLNKGQ